MCKEDIVLHDYYTKSFKLATYDVKIDTDLGVASVMRVVEKYFFWFSVFMSSGLMNNEPCYDAAWL